MDLPRFRGKGELKIARVLLDRLSSQLVRCLLLKSDADTAFHAGSPSFPRLRLAAHILCRRANDVAQHPLPQMYGS